MFSADRIRQEIEEEYKVRDGVIESAGRFEGAPVFAPYFFALWEEGLADNDDGESARFVVTAADLDVFPEIGDGLVVVLCKKSHDQIDAYVSGA